MLYNFYNKNWELYVTEMFNVLKCHRLITRYIIISIQICCISSPSQKLSPHYYRKDNSYYNTILRFRSCQNNSYLYWDIFLRVALVVVESRRVHWYLILYTEVILHTHYFSSINYNTSTMTLFIQCKSALQGSFISAQNSINTPCINLVIHPPRLTPEPLFLLIYLVVCLVNQK